MSSEADFPPGSIVMGPRGQFWVNTGDGWLEVDWPYTEFGVKSWEYINDGQSVDPIWPERDTPSDPVVAKSG